MIERSLRAQNTPSVCFNFDESNMKSDRFKDLTANNHSQENETIPFEYSDTGYKNLDRAQTPKPELQATPLHSYVLENQEIKLPVNDSSSQNISKKKYETAVYEELRGEGKVDTEEFFDDFENNFIVKFGDSPVRYEQNFDFRKTVGNSSDGSDQKAPTSKVGSYISEPLHRELYQNHEEVFNQQALEIVDLEKELCVKTKSRDKAKRAQKCGNSQKNKNSKFPFEVRKRMMFKNQENLINKSNKNKSKPGRKLINSENLMIVTSSGWGGWTGIPECRKQKSTKQAKSHPIKSCDKSMKTDNNIFNSHQMFKETLRSTTLDNWRKKFTVHKSSIEKRNRGCSNIFQRPFGMR